MVGENSSGFWGSGAVVEEIFLRLGKVAPGKMAQGLAKLVLGFGKTAQMFEK